MNQLTEFLGEEIAKKFVETYGNAEQMEIHKIYFEFLNTTFCVVNEDHDAISWHDFLSDPEFVQKYLKLSEQGSLTKCFSFYHYEIQLSIAMYILDELGGISVRIGSTNNHIVIEAEIG